MTKQQINECWCKYIPRDKRKDKAMLTVHQMVVLWPGCNYIDSWCIYCHSLVEQILGFTYEQNFNDLVEAHLHNELINIDENVYQDTV